MTGGEKGDHRDQFKEILKRMMNPDNQGGQGQPMNMKKMNPNNQGGQEKPM
jgi:hypothetical protein